MEAGFQLVIGASVFSGVGRAVSAPWAIKQECFGDSSKAGPGEGQRGEGGGGVYGLGEFKGGGAGCLGGPSGRGDGVFVHVTGCFGGLGGHSGGRVFVWELGAQ